MRYTSDPSTALERLAAHLGYTVEVIRAGHRYVGTGNRADGAVCMGTVARCLYLLVIKCTAKAEYKGLGMTMAQVQDIVRLSKVPARAKGHELLLLRDLVGWYTRSDKTRNDGRV